MKRDEYDEWIIKRMEEEIGRLENRLAHLLESETIRMFDEKDWKTGEYVRNIKRLDSYGLPCRLLGHEAKMKPPLGVMPRELWEKQRARDLFDAMLRYAKAGKAIPGEWPQELLQLLGAKVEVEEVEA